MTTTTTKVPYADASPAELREAILPEERDQFDASFRRALDQVAQTLTLDALDSFLQHWRRVAWAQNAHGHDSWRALLAEVECRLAGGAPPRDGVGRGDECADPHCRVWKLTREKNLVGSD
ncbi:MAG TPA: DUF6247 family protein [Pseudonocardiaceae bacterium]|nr:DUF6247 family protein [Pseudonocardiaceae bacterium]